MVDCLARVSVVNRACCTRQATTPANRADARIAWRHLSLSCCPDPTIATTDNRRIRTRYLSNSRRLLSSRNCPYCFKQANLMFSCRSGAQPRITNNHRYAPPLQHVAKNDFGTFNMAQSRFAAQYSKEYITESNPESIYPLSTSGLFSMVSASKSPRIFPRKCQCRVKEYLI